MRGRPKKMNKLDKILNVRFSGDVHLLIQKYAELSNLDESSFVRQVISEHLINVDKIFTAKTKHDCMVCYHAFMRNFMVKMEDILRLRDPCQKGS